MTRDVADAQEVSRPQSASDMKWQSLTSHFAVNATGGSAERKNRRRAVPVPVLRSGVNVDDFDGIVKACKVWRLISTVVVFVVL